ncbi:HAMP domain-containing protein [Pseudocnuella soli]
MRIQNKIAFLLILATTTILVSLALFIYIFVSKDTSISFDQKLSYRVHLLQRSFTDSAEKNSFQKQEKLSREQHYIIPIGEDSLLFARQGWPEALRRSVLTDGHAYWQDRDVYYIGERCTINSENYIVVMSAVDEYQKEYLGYLEKILLIGLGIALVFLFAMAVVFSRRVFVPVQNITAQVKKLGTGNMHLRLPKAKGTDEMANLTDTFNEMLDRMETAFEAQKNFVSHASHEFNTPLTTIIGEAEFALGREKTC